MNSNTQRKIHYIDPAVQNRLLIAFVLLEVLLISAGMIMLYLDLKTVAEENLYRIHFAAREPLSVLLFREAMRTLAVLVILNMAVFGLAEWLWSRYLDSITHPFSDLLIRTGNLDFAPDESPGRQHAVLGLVSAWRENERERCKGIRAVLSGLDENDGHASVSEHKQTRAALESLKALLPAHKSGSKISQLSPLPQVKK